MDHGSWHCGNRFLNALLFQFHDACIHHSEGTTYRQDKKRCNPITPVSIDMKKRNQTSGRASSSSPSIKTVILKFITQFLSRLCLISFIISHLHFIYSSAFIFYAFPILSKHLGHSFTLICVRGCIIKPHTE